MKNLILLNVATTEFVVETMTGELRFAGLHKPTVS